jgi:Domain of unknown function (DUF4145)
MGHCPKCGADRYANVICAHTKVTKDYEEEFQILQCAGCKTVYFGTEYNDEYNYGTTYYPEPAKRKRPHWFSSRNLERTLYSLLNETYNALEADAHVLSAIGARTIFDRASELLGIDPAMSFKQKLYQLHSKGHISASEREHLDILTDAGGAAAHRGWKPGWQQLDTIMLLIETFVHRKFILEAAAKQLQAQIPPRQK